MDEENVENIKKYQLKIGKSFYNQNLNLYNTIKCKIDQNFKIKK